MKDLDLLMTESETMKVIMSVRNIPSGSVVTKPTGLAQFLLKREIRFFPRTKELGEQSRTTAYHGCVFLINETGDVSVYPPDQKLGWLVEPEELRDHMDALLERWERTSEK